MYPKDALFLNTYQQNVDPLGGQARDEGLSHRDYGVVNAYLGCTGNLPSICPSNYPSVRLSIHPSICQSIQQTICPSIHPSIHPSGRTYAHQSTHLYIHPSVRSSIGPSIHSSLLVYQPTPCTLITMCNEISWIYIFHVVLTLHFTTLHYII